MAEANRPANMRSNMDTIWIQTRTAGRPWRIEGKPCRTERTARARVAALAQSAASPEFTVRAAQWDIGSPYDAISNPTQVLMTRQGCADATVTA